MRCPRYIPTIRCASVEILGQRLGLSVWRPRYIPTIRCASVEILGLRLGLCGKFMRGGKENNLDKQSNFKVKR